MKGIYLHTAILLAILPRFAVAQTRTVGLILHDEKRAAPGYTLVAPKHYTRTYLIDNNGRVVRTWDSCYEPGQSAHLLPNGHLLRAAMVQVPGGGTGGGEGGRIEEYDWDGNLVWEFDYATQNYSLHHDIRPLPNGNVIALVDEWVPPVSADGSYSKAASGTLWGPAAPTWTFVGEYATKYFEEAISGAQRLPNGNTLICYGTHGVLIEITPQKETVWQYINPVVKEGPLWQGQSARLDDRGHQYNAVFKVRRYAPDYPGLAGKDLTPGRVIELSGVRVLNGASFREDPGAPGALLTIASDEALSDGTAQPSGSTLPTRLAGTVVEITDSKGQTQQCPLYYVSPQQINAVVPETCARGLSTINVRRDSGATQSAPLTLDQTAPGLFTLDGTVGAVQALRVDSAGRRTDIAVYRYDDAKKAFALVPIDLGPAGDQIYLSLYATGVRGSDSQRVSASVGGESVAVLGVAAQARYPGLDQINIGPLPRTLAGHGMSQIAFTTGGRQSNPVTVSIR